MSNELEPIAVTVDAVLVTLDRIRCMAVRADIPGYLQHRKTVNGAIPTKRCENRAAYVASERRPNESGHLHQMTVCSVCRREMERQRPGMIDYSPL